MLRVPQHNKRRETKETAISRRCHVFYMQNIDTGPISREQNAFHKTTQMLAALQIMQNSTPMPGVVYFPSSELCACRQLAIITQLYFTNIHSQNTVYNCSHHMAGRNEAMTTWNPHLTSNICSTSGSSSAEDALSKILCQKNTAQESRESHQLYLVILHVLEHLDGHDPIKCFGRGKRDNISRHHLLRQQAVTVIYNRHLLLHMA